MPPDPPPDLPPPAGQPPGPGRPALGGPAARLPPLAQHHSHPPRRVLPSETNQRVPDQRGAL